ncbi:MAG: exodeoxyribonuclease VII large subunit [Clostridia bacterium]|nr:exodeoxyribonuclease VII large subunit [Clostridia bacterium]
MEQSALSVSQLNFFIKSLFESEPRLRRVTVSGEISNFVNHYKTGHLYFSLKDDTSSIKAVMFRSDASRLSFRPENGMEVLLTGRVSVYERDGVYQIYAEKMIPAGVGALAAAYEQLKKKLTAEGLFDSSKKRQLPLYPRRIGVITSRSGAAVRDIFNTLSRRWPVAEISLYPVLVQGTGAAESVAAAIAEANERGTDDVLIIARGGGSAEDLWAFNEEVLVRAVAASEIPTVSGVGHETDFTLCDFAADLRASTPTAAAERCSPDIEEEFYSVKRLDDRLKDGFFRRIDDMRYSLQSFGVDRVKNRIVAMIDGGSQYVDSLDSRMTLKMSAKLDSSQLDVARLAGALDLMNPMKILSRGYAVCEKDGGAVRDISYLSVGDAITLRMIGGNAECTVNEKKEFENE